MDSTIVCAAPSSVSLAGRYRIGKAFTFEASHRLLTVSSPRRCAGTHGHSYTAGVMLSSDVLVGPGFVTDFGDLDAFERYLANSLDHRDLNEVLGVDPTRRAIEEHLACWLVDNLAPRIPGRLEAIRVTDTAAVGGHRIGRTYSFAASHRLSGLPPGHKCARGHGHSYVVGLVLDSDRTVPAGFVSDCGGLDVFGDYITDTLNTDLNQVLDVEPTSERIAEHLAGWFTEHVQPCMTDRLRSVWVSETPATWASYTPE